MFRAFYSILTHLTCTLKALNVRIKKMAAWGCSAVEKPIFEISVSRLTGKETPEKKNNWSFTQVIKPTTSFSLTGRRFKNVSGALWISARASLKI